MAKQIAEITTKLLWALIALMITLLMSFTIYQADGAQKDANENKTEVVKLQVQVAAERKLRETQDNTNKESLKRIEDDTRYIKEQLVQHLIDGE